MTMYVDKSTNPMTIVSLHFLAKKKGVPIVYKMEDNPVMLARLDTEVVVDEQYDDVATPHCEFVEGAYKRIYRPYTAEELASQEQAWAEQELAKADKEVFKFEDGHARSMRGTIGAWRTYRNALRDHVIDGVVQGPRPTAPV